MERKGVEIGTQGNLALDEGRTEHSVFLFPSGPARAVCFPTARQNTFREAEVHSSSLYCDEIFTKDAITCHVTIQEIRVGYEKVILMPVEQCILKDRSCLLQGLSLSKEIQ